MIFLNFIKPDFVVARAWLLAWVLMIALGIGNRFVVRRQVSMSVVSCENRLSRTTFYVLGVTTARTKESNHNDPPNS